MQNKKGSRSFLWYNTYIKKIKGLQTVRLPAWWHHCQKHPDFQLFWVDDVTIFSHGWLVMYVSAVGVWRASNCDQMHQIKADVCKFAFTLAEYRFSHYIMFALPVFEVWRQCACTYTCYVLLMYKLYIFCSVLMWIISWFGYFSFCRNSQSSFICLLYHPDKIFSFVYLFEKLILQ